MRISDKEDFLTAFEQTTQKMLDLVRRKNNDYTVSEDPFDNFNAVEDFDICDAETGILVRMSDKFKRAIALLGGKEQKVKDESIEDTLLDLANYAIILKLRRGHRNALEKTVPLEREFVMTQGL